MFQDIGFGLSELLFEVDSEGSYQLSGLVMQWRGDIKALRFLLHKWLPSFHHRSLVPIALFPQILWLCGGDGYAALVTRRRGREFQGADLRVPLSDQVD